MLKEIADAIETQDYQTAAKLLKQLQKSEPRNPWVWYYIGRLYEETDKPESAEKNYRQLLRHINNVKLLSLCRQGLKRLQIQQQQQQQFNREAALSQPGGEEPGILVIKSVPSELKQDKAQEFAKIFQIDAYNARLQLPSRGWRLYRTGVMGDLQPYTEKLQAVRIPCFSLSLRTLTEIEVYQVSHFEQVTPEVIVACQSPDRKPGQLTFKWSEVQKQVEGLLPLFEEVTEKKARGKTERKMKVLDYISCLDLHLTSRQIILRLNDRAYNFQQGIPLTTIPDTVSLVGNKTTRQKWTSLIQFLSQSLPNITKYNNFTSFGETALGFPKLLEQIDPVTNIYRRYDTLWDSAFHLYSCSSFHLQKEASQED